MTHGPSSPSKLLVAESRRTSNLEAIDMFYSVQVTGNRQMWYQNARHITKVTGTRFLVPVTCAKNLNRVPWALYPIHTADADATVGVY